MKEMQRVFNAIKQAQAEQKVIKQVYRDLQANSQPYQTVLEELTTLKEKKKALEVGFQAEMRVEFDKLDELKLDIEGNKEILSDLAFNSLVKGETIDITDEYENKYEPQFTVRFKKL